MAEAPTPDVLLEFRQHCRRGLTLLHQSVLNSARTGRRDPAFRSLSVEEINTRFESLREELDAEVRMMVVAAHEASVMLDARRRAEAGGQDAFGLALHRLFSRPKEGRGAPAPEDIPGAWKRHAPGTSRATGAFMQAYRYRHWLAHGRWFLQRSGLDRLEPLGADERGSAMARKLRLSRA
jgi:hypothetical protein